MLPIRLPAAPLRMLGIKHAMLMEEDCLVAVAEQLKELKRGHVALYETKGVSQECHKPAIDVRYATEFIERAVLFCHAMPRHTQPLHAC